MQRSRWVPARTRAFGCGGQGWGGEREADEQHHAGSNNRWLQQTAKMWQPTSKEMKADATCLYIIYCTNMLFSIRGVALWNPLYKDISFIVHGFTWLHCVWKKGTPTLSIVTLKGINGFWRFLAQVFLKQLAIKRLFNFPPHPTSASALPGENGTNEILHFIQGSIITWLK